MWSCLQATSSRRVKFQHMLLLLQAVILERRRGSSVSIIDNLTTNWTNGVRSPVGAKNFSPSHCVQTRSGAHPVSYPMGTGGPFSGDEPRPGRDADHSPHLVPKSITIRNYTSSPTSASMACSGTALL
jgi:hypothetical protein